MIRTVFASDGAWYMMCGPTAVRVELRDAQDEIIPAVADGSGIADASVGSLQGGGPRPADAPSDSDGTDIH